MPHLFLVIGLVMAQILALREVLGNQEGKMEGDVIRPVADDACS